MPFGADGRGGAGGQGPRREDRACAAARRRATIAAVNVPETRYASSDGVNIAYQVVGSGPFDLVYVPGLGLEHRVDVGGAAPRRVPASDSRRSPGSSCSTSAGPASPTPCSDDHLPTLERRMDDVRAVMDAAGSERAALLGHSEGGNMCIVFSASFPERTSALVLLGELREALSLGRLPVGAGSGGSRTRDPGGGADLGAGRPRADARSVPRRGRGVPELVQAVPAASASPRAAAALLRMNTDIDTRAVLPAIRVPTLCIYRIRRPRRAGRRGPLHRGPDPRGAVRRAPGRGSPDVGGRRLGDPG